MTKKSEKTKTAPGSPAATDLGREAEEQVREKVKSAERTTKTDVRALLHELQVRQIELEMQNDELLSTQTAVQEVSDKYHDLFDFAPIGYFRLDGQGRILEVNLAGASLLGLACDRGNPVILLDAFSVLCSSMAEIHLPLVEERLQCREESIGGRS